MPTKKRRAKARQPLRGVTPTPVLVGQNNAVTAGTGLAVTVGAGGVPKDNRILVSYDSNNLEADASPTCADSKGNPYVVDDESKETGGSHRLIHFSAPANTALVSGDTITVTAPSNGRRAMMVRHAPVLAKDVGTKGNGFSATPSSGVTATRTAAEALVYGVFGWRGTVVGDTLTAGTGFTGALTEEAQAGGVSRYVATEYKTVTAVGTDAATGTLPANREWRAIVVAYPAAGGAAGRLVNRRARLSSRVGGTLAA